LNHSYADDGVQKCAHVWRIDQLTSDRFRVERYWLVCKEWHVTEAKAPSTVFRFEGPRDAIFTRWRG